MSKRDNPRLKQREADKEQKKDASRGRTSDAPRGRTSDAPRGRTSDAPRGRSGDAPRGRTSDAPRGRSGDAPDWKKDAPRGRTSDAPRGRSGEAPAWKKDAPRGRSGEAPDWKKDAPRGRSGEAPAWKKDAPRGRSGEAPAWKKDAPRGRSGDAPAWKKDAPRGRNSDAREERSNEMPAWKRESMYNGGRKEIAEPFEENPNLIIGRNPVMEAVKSGRQIEKLMMQKDGEGSIRKIASLAREQKIMIQYVERIVLDKLCPGRPHQGVAAIGAAHDYCELEDILAAAKEKGEDPFIILLDGLEDPHNLGAIMRTADAAGVHGIIIPSRRAVGLTETVAKASAGAIEYVPVAKVGNIVSAIEQLKAAGLWIAACDLDGQKYSEAELTGPIGIVVGGEGQGVSRLVREKCDYVLSIPMKGKISSLNASNAAALLMYEVCRRRDGGK